MSDTNGSLRILWAAIDDEPWEIEHETVEIQLSHFSFAELRAHSPREFGERGFGSAWDGDKDPELCGYSWMGFPIRIVEFVVDMPPTYMPIDLGIIPSFNEIPRPVHITIKYQKWNDRICYADDPRNQKEWM